ncbi:hypothetical protein QVD17_27234 [Tagetes erecta]|uniref:Uncharacterized protein n=1 Tax=Tagetes erecta TaxID=13708 RepID=A0AAD8NJ72_TARER|nr:hypothetical protein QVD17_27234 [Tagetes erecta]
MEELLWLVLPNQLPGNHDYHRRGSFSLPSLRRIITGDTNKINFRLQFQLHFHSQVSVVFVVIDLSRING